MTDKERSKVVRGIHRRRYSTEQKEEVIQFLLSGRLPSSWGKKVISPLYSSTAGKGNTWMENWIERIMIKQSTD